jgi:hypothetical protein
MDEFDARNFAKSHERTERGLSIGGRDVGERAKTVAVKKDLTTSVVGCREVKSVRDGDHLNLGGSKDLTFYNNRPRFKRAFTQNFYCDRFRKELSRVSVRYP